MVVRKKRKKKRRGKKEEEKDRPRDVLVLGGRSGLNYYYECIGVLIYVDNLISIQISFFIRTTIQELKHHSKVLASQSVIIGKTVHIST